MNRDLATLGDWAEVSEYAGHGAVAHTLVFSLPLFVTLDSARVDDTGQSVHTTDVNLFGPLGLPVLPFWASAEFERYEEGEPPARAGASWNPFWTTTWSENWAAEDGELDAWGIPLLLGGFSVATPRGGFEVHQALWTLGPVVGWGDIENTETYFVWPLYLGGLGALLWQSMGVTSGTERIQAHGPLLGLLGYVGVEETEADLTRSSWSTLLGGALWLSTRTTDAEGLPQDGFNGPLWGMVGWGESDGERCIRLLWLPITF